MTDSLGEWNLDVNWDDHEVEETIVTSYRFFGFPDIPAGVLEFGLSDTVTDEFDSRMRKDDVASAMGYLGCVGVANAKARKWRSRLTKEQLETVACEADQLMFVAERDQDVDAAATVFEYCWVLEGHPHRDELVARIDAMLVGLA